MTETGDSGSADRANVVALPPLIYLASVVAGLVLQRVIGGRIVDADTGRWVMGLVLLGAGVSVELWFSYEFKRMGQDVRPTTPTPSITAHGPFGLSRNPAYVGMTAIQCGLALVLNNPWLLATLAPTLVVMHYGVILREEAYLERAFGDEYLHYKKSVRRYL